MAAYAKRNAPPKVEKPKAVKMAEKWDELVDRLPTAPVHPQRVMAAYRKLTALPKAEKPKATPKAHAGLLSFCHGDKNPGCSHSPHQHPPLGRALALWFAKNSDATTELPAGHLRGREGAEFWRKNV